MKIDAKKFTKLMKKFMMDSSSQIVECLLDFNEEGLEIKAMTGGNLATSYIKINKTFFTDYENIGKIGVINFGEFVSAFDKFKSIIDLNLSGVTLILKEKNKKILFPISDEDIITDTYKEINLEYECYFELTPKDIKDIFETTKIKNNKIEHYQIEITDKVYITAVGKYKSVFEYDKKYENVSKKASFASIFQDCIYAIAANDDDTRIKIFIEDDAPITIIEESDDHILKVVIAPFIVNEEQ
jgi:hypothetical protein